MAMAEALAPSEQLQQHPQSRKQRGQDVHRLLTYEFEYEYESVYVYIYVFVFLSQQNICTYFINRVFHNTLQQGIFSMFSVLSTKRSSMQR